MCVEPSPAIWKRHSICHQLAPRLAIVESAYLEGLRLDYQGVLTSRLSPAILALKLSRIVLIPNVEIECSLSYLHARCSLAPHCCFLLNRCWQRWCCPCLGVRRRCGIPAWSSFKRCCFVGTFMLMPVQNGSVAEPKSCCTSP